MVARVLVPESPPTSPKAPRQILDPSDPRYRSVPESPPASPKANPQEAYQTPDSSQADARFLAMASVAHDNDPLTTRQSTTALATNYPNEWFMVFNATYGMRSTSRRDIERGVENYVRTHRNRPDT